MQLRVKIMVLMLAVTMQACSNLPRELQQAPEVEMEYAQVNKDVDAYLGMPVRWGGMIVAVENGPQISSAQILYYPLFHYAKPNLNAQALGRFVILSSNFLDPEIYAKGKVITIAGNIEGGTVRSIGDKDVTLPVVHLRSSYIWPQRKQYAYRPYYYPPYYGFRYRPFAYPLRYSACY